MYTRHCVACGEEFRPAMEVLKGRDGAVAAGAMSYSPPLVRFASSRHCSFA